MWGSRWVMEGDFNDIKNNEKKKGGRRMQESGIRDFRNFISGMELGDIKLKTESYYQVNNRQWCSAEWKLQYDIAEVRHFLRQASDH